MCCVYVVRESVASRSHSINPYDNDKYDLVWTGMAHCENLPVFLASDILLHPASFHLL